MVSQQLQRNRVHRGRLEIAHVFGHLNDGHAIRSGNAGLGIREHDQFTATCANLHEIGFELLQQIIVRRHRDYGHIGINQRERSMLQLSGGIGLGMNVGNLLELQCAFHGDRVHGAAAKEQGVLLVGKSFGQLVNDRIERQRFFHERRQFNQALHEAAFALGVSTMMFGDCDNQHTERGELRRERFGRRHPDFRARPR